MASESLDELVEMVGDRAAAGLQFRDQREERERGGDAVLVAHGAGIDEIAERLLESEHEPGSAGDPLEAGERRVEVEAVGARDGLEPGGGDEGARERSVRARVARHRRGATGGPPAEQQADLVAGETPAAVGGLGIGDGDRETVGVGVVRDDEFGVDLASASEARSIAPGSSGFGNATVGKAPSGSICSSTRLGVANPAASSIRAMVSQPTPCIAVYTTLGCVVCASAASDVCRTYASTTDSAATLEADARELRHGRRLGHPLDVRGDLGIGGRHDLRAVVVAAEVHLVAVVVRRVVAGGHHDAGRGAEVAHGERQHRRRQQPGEQDRADPGAAKISAESRANTSELRRPS